MDYLRRIFDHTLSEYLEAFGAVLIEGPKWCGKTTTAEQQARSVLKMQNTDELEANMATAQTKPSILLRGDTPRLLDEWQVAPQLWDAVRNEVDERQDVGQFILTGSNTVDKTQIKHSGNGRIARLKMTTMSLWESLESNGCISLKELFNNPSGDIDGLQSSLSVDQLVFAACRGGWPASLSRKTDNAKLLVAKNYFTTVCESDIQNVDGVERSASLAKIMLRSYARNISTLAKKSGILADMNAMSETLSPKTFDDYQNALQRLFVIQDIEAWNPAIRSKTAIRSGLKRSFADPSIATAAMGASPAALMDDLPTFGLMFESLAVRDLRTYAELIDGRLYHYLDKSGLECDIVIHLRDGRYGLVEVKLGGDRLVDKGASSLLSVADKIDLTRMKKPSFLMVLVADGDFAYRRKDDGVIVCPLAALKP